MAVSTSTSKKRNIGSLLHTAKQLISSLVHLSCKPPKSSSSNPMPHDTQSSSHGGSSKQRKGYALLVEEIKLQDSKAPEGYVPVLFLGTCDGEGGGDDDRESCGDGDSDGFNSSYISDDTYSSRHGGGYGHYGEVYGDEGYGEPQYHHQHACSDDDDGSHGYGTQLVFVRASLLGHPAMADLLQQSALMFGYSRYCGPLRLPCDVDDFRRLLLFLSPPSPARPLFYLPTTKSPL